MKHYKLINEKNSEEVVALVSSADAALAHFSKELNVQFSFCKEPSNYRLDGGNTNGMWNPDESYFVEKARA